MRPNREAGGEAEAHRNFRRALLEQVAYMTQVWNGDIAESLRLAIRRAMQDPSPTILHESLSSFCRRFVNSTIMRH